ncbi:hypothetical protein LTR02_002476 [Friedmanniomyces endolithicus]|nr:hypothetical protein LTR59_006453 [Friedmanniomyces endolithicus]KAK0804370.1 hypothetical protein LTR75_007685 [Friedmanniomyces endolithicus]KAK0811302.1 hypothetical protein LTR38_003630 [Friedmanniomyces endolithicus]KAK0845168.1 hypothetical protein LTR03_007666 [Friedmanniomyces endolithicus]KAK0913107.1 hypothetical protein LTR02_002476 [Friedmanniomyces endolithicus]
MAEAVSPIELDGRTLEGGGQLIRIALCLSALTSKPVKITNIRGNRSGGGGLKAQHLACVDWLAQACSVRVEGAEKGAKTLLFVPHAARSVERKDSLNVPPVFRKRTLKNGSRAILPFVLFTKLPGSEENGIPIRLTLSGGTNVSGSPSYDYITQVLLPTLENIGFPGITATIAKRGWSHGGTSIGEITLEIPATTRLPLPPFHLTRQDPPIKRRTAPCSLTATVIAPPAYQDHFRDRLTTAIAMHFNLNNHASDFPLKVQCEDSHHDKRLYLLLVAQIPVHEHQPDVTSDSSSTCTPSATHHFLGRDWLYDRKLPPNGHPKAIADMAGRVVRELHGEVSSGACVDEHLRDQVVIFQALAKGRSVVFAGEDEDEDGEGWKAREPSLHARTAEWVCREMLGVRFDAGGVCEGVGYGGNGPEDGGAEGARPRDLVERIAELRLGDSEDGLS